MATSTTMATAIGTLWHKKILKAAEGKMVLDKWAMKEGIPNASGKTIKVNRLLRTAKQTSAGTPGTILKIDSANTFTSNSIDLVYELWNDSFYINEDVDVTAIIQDPKFQDNVANQVARTHEFQIMKKLHNGGAWWHPDGMKLLDQEIFTASGTETLTNLETALTGSDDIWNTGQVVFYDPSLPAYGEAALVADFADTNGVVTLSSTVGLNLFNIPTDAIGWATVKTNIVAGDKMTVARLLEVAAVHEHNQTPKFDGGTLRGVMDNDQYHDLLTDTNWKDYVKHDRSSSFENYASLRWYDMEFLVSSESYRTSVTNVYAASAAVHACPIFGKDSYAVFRFGNGSGAFSTEFFLIDKADSYNMTLARKGIAWKSTWAAGVLNATSVVNLLTGASGTGLAAI